MCVWLEPDTLSALWEEQCELGGGALHSHSIDYPIIIVFESTYYLSEPSDIMKFVIKQSSSQQWTNRKLCSGPGPEAAGGRITSGCCDITGSLFWLVPGSKNGLKNASYL